MIWILEMLLIGLCVLTVLSELSPRFHHNCTMTICRGGIFIGSVLIIATIKDTQSLLFIESLIVFIASIFLSWLDFLWVIYKEKWGAKPEH